MKGKKLTVVDDPEMMRIKQNTAIQSNVEYHKVRDQLSEMEQKRPDREARGMYHGDREPVYRSQGDLSTDVCVCVCGNSLQFLGELSTVVCAHSTDVTVCAHRTCHIVTPNQPLRYW